MTSLVAGALQPEMRSDSIVCGSMEASGANVAGIGVTMRYPAFGTKILCVHRHRAGAAAARFLERIRKECICMPRVTYWGARMLPARRARDIRQRSPVA